MIEYIVIFLLFSIIGFIYESLIGKTVNMCGDSLTNALNICAPVLTIYGFAAVILVVLRNRFPDMNILYLSVIATLIITIFECIGGQLSYIYNGGNKTWTYGNQTLCDGYISPFVSIGWFIFILIFYWIYEKII